MEYTIRRLGSLAGVSTRTLRYYDEIGLLKPCRISSSGYRIYGAYEVERLQQIMFYRSLDVSLDTIKDILSSLDYSPSKSLREHRDKLIKKREQLDQLISNVNKTIEAHEGRIIMSDKERFDGFKQKMVEENEQKYGKEIREKYGNKVVDKSNERMLNMTEAQHDKAGKLYEETISTLLLAFDTGDAAGELARKAVELHKEWLCIYWDSYSKEAHAALGRMYVEDERFKVNYDKHQPGLAEFFRDAIEAFTC